MSGSNNRSRLASTRRKILGTIGGGSVLGLAGCLGGGDDDDGSADENVLNFGLTGSTSTVDPVNSSSSEESIIFNNIFETLVATGNDGNLYNWLADTYEITDVQDIGAADYEPYMREVPLDEEGFAAPEDGAQIILSHPDNEAGDDTGLTLTVEEAPDAVDDGTYGVQLNAVLHEGVEFHNGEELTAQHVVDSYARHRNTEFGTQVFDTFLYAEAVGDYEVNIYGQVPDVEADRRLPVPYIFSEEQMDFEPGDMDPRGEAAPIGTGPYQFSDFEDSQFWELERHDNYWMQEVGLDNKDWWDGEDDFPEQPEIEMLNLEVISETSTRSGALESGEIDATFNLTPDQRDNFDSSEDYGVDGTPAGGFTYFQLPAREEADGPFHHREVREAFNRCVPRDLIVEEVRNGFSENAVVPVPRVAGGTSTFGYDDAVDEFEDMVAYDEEMAADLIDQAGVETPIETTIVTNGDNDPRAALANLTVESMNGTDLWDISLETEASLDALSEYIEQDGFWETNEIVLIGLGGGVVPELYIQVTHSPAYFQACCQYQNLNFPELSSAIQEASTSIQAVEDPDYRRQVWMDDVHPTVLEESANVLTDYEEETIIFNNNILEGVRKSFNQASTISYMTYAPYDGVAASINVD